MKQKKPQPQPQPANCIRAIDRKRFTREEVEAELERRRNLRTCYESR